MKLSLKAAPISALCLVLSGSALAESSIEHHGYMRAGIGYSDNGTDQVCFVAPGSETSHTRLGNECDSYIETSLVHTKKLGDGDNAAQFKTQLSLGLSTANHRDWEPTTVDYEADNPGTTVDETSHSSAMALALREAYTQGWNLFSGSQIAPWVGKRYYRRHDIHLMDFYLIDNTGPGAGIEDFDLGVGKFHVALTRNVPKSEDAPAQSNLDLRLSDIKVAHGNLTLIMIRGTTGERGHQSGVKAYEAMSGNQLGVFYNIGFASGGFNKTTFQYGTGLYGAYGNQGRLHQWGAWGDQTVLMGDSDGKDHRMGSSTSRLTNQFVRSGEKFSYSFVLFTQSSQFGGAKDIKGDERPTKTELTLGTRIVSHLSDYFSVATELGYTSIAAAIAPATASDDWQDSQLTKVTVAPTIGGKGYWNRPQLRLFATHASWNDASKGMASKNGSTVYASETSGMSYGAQMETWW